MFEQLDFAGADAIFGIQIDTNTQGRERGRGRLSYVRLTHVR